MPIVKLNFGKPDLSFLLIVLLLSTLSTLAVLQYRWIGQTSADELDRAQRRERLAAENFSRDFDREVTRAFLQLQVDPISFDRKNWDNYALRYERWTATAPYPKLIKNVFVAERNADDSGLRLSVYNETTRRFEESLWAPQLARVQSEIEQDLKFASAADGAKKPRAVAEVIAPEAPALAIPIPTINLLDIKNIQSSATQNKILSGEAIRRVGYTIVLLDLDYIKGELLPALATRYFDSAEDGNEYNIIVANRAEPPQIIYHSGSLAATPDTSLTGDVERDLFALRLDEIENLLPTLRRNQVQSSKAAGEKLMPNISVSVITASPSIDSSSTAASSAIPQLKNQEGDWRLFVQHRNGSLVSAVETMRRRNSIIGFGMLLLLASSGVLLIVLLNRSRGFARRQTDFVAGVTHELRTPLAVIRAASENIADGIVTDAAQIREYGVMINEEERRLSAMVEQVLEFAGAQQLTRNNRYEFTPDSVAEILEAALNDYQTELKERGFRVVLEIEPHLPEIMADRDALRRAVGNLIGNAVKYSNRTEERRIVIKARSVQKKASEQIEITLEDNGAGIEKSELPHIFKLFYRGRTATENQIKGSGIGLSLVKQIVKAHGGSISVKSETGRGSAFTLRLPVE